MTSTNYIQGLTLENVLNTLKIKEDSISLSINNPHEAYHPSLKNAYQALCRNYEIG